jgi:hypothetical protein
MHGGKRIAEGEAVLVLEGGNAGGQQLFARRCHVRRAVAKKRTILWQTPPASFTIGRASPARRRPGQSALKSTASPQAAPNGKILSSGDERDRRHLPMTRAGLLTGLFLPIAWPWIEPFDAQPIARGRQAMTSSSLIAGLPAENIDLC